MLEFYNQIDIDNPQLIADRVILRLQKHKNYLSHQSMQEQKFQHRSIQSLKEQLKHMQTDLHNLEIKISAYGSADSLQQKLMKSKSCSYKKTTTHAGSPCQKIPKSNQIGHYRSHSCNLHDGSVMKKILYDSEPPNARIRRSSSVQCNYDDLYNKQERRIAKTITRSPQGRSKIVELIKRDKSKFYS